MKTQKEFSQFEEASTYARELARKLCSPVSVLRTEKGWIVTHQTAPHQISDVTDSGRSGSIKPTKKTKTPKKTSKTSGKKFPGRCDRNIPGPKDHLCVDCGNLIPQARVKAIPNVQRCTECQSLNERQNPSLVKRKVDEGLAGSRDDHKKMRARQWSDMIRRHRE